MSSSWEAFCLYVKGVSLCGSQGLSVKIGGLDGLSKVRQRDESKVEVAKDGL